MKKLIFPTLFMLIFIQLWAGNFIDQDKNRWKPYFKNIVPAKIADKWYLPFTTATRKNLKELQVISTFGSARNSYKKGHIHTGLDCIPAGKDSFVYVYPIANGVVCSIHLGAPHKTIVVKHKDFNGKTIYSSYKHLAQVFVNIGRQVNKDTKIARLYSRQETRKLNGRYDHLHLEIRKKFDDYGCASWLTMTKKELNERFYDPLSFLKKKI